MPRYHERHISRSFLPPQDDRLLDPTFDFPLSHPSLAKLPFLQKAAR
jgi:hypothetical protein